MVIALTFVANRKLFKVSFVWAAIGDKLQNMSVLLWPVEEKQTVSALYRSTSRQVDLPDNEYMSKLVKVLSLYPTCALSLVLFSDSF